MTIRRWRRLPCPYAGCQAGDPCPLCGGRGWTLYRKARHGVRFQRLPKGWRS